MGKEGVLAKDDWNEGEKLFQKYRTDILFTSTKQAKNLLKMSQQVFNIYAWKRQK